MQTSAKEGFNLLKQILLKIILLIFGNCKISLIVRSPLFNTIIALQYFFPASLKDQPRIDSKLDEETDLMFSILAKKIR